MDEFKEDTRSRGINGYKCRWLRRTQEAVEKMVTNVDGVGRNMKANTDTIPKQSIIFGFKSHQQNLTKPQ